MRALIVMPLFFGRTVQAANRTPQIGARQERLQPLVAFMGASGAIRTALIMLTVLGAGSAAAQTRPEDLPPPPGSLERSFGMPSDPVVTSGAGPSLSKPIDIPFAIEGGHIIIQASIDGGAPKPFVFDTGARIAITPDVARPMNAVVERTGRVGGTGPKISHADLIRVGRITIGAATLEQPAVIVVEIPNIIVDRGSRPRLAGLIGSELLARYAVTIDYSRRVLILNAPGFRPQSAAFSLPLTMIMMSDGLSHPSIPAELDGAAGDFMIDTGSGGQVFVSEKFQQEHQPFADIRPILHFLSPGGIGGPVSIKEGFGKRLRIGSSTLSPPVVSGVAESRGATLGRGSESHISGLIGGVVLAQFIVTIDYQSLRAYFEPVAGHPLPTVLHGTGLILNKPDHETFEVLDVLQGTAAERAGLRRGDRIIEIAGHPARDLAAWDVQALSSVPAHSSLTIRTSDQRRIDLAIGRTLP